MKIYNIIIIAFVILSSKSLIAKSKYDKKQNKNLQFSQIIKLDKCVTVKNAKVIKNTIYKDISWYIYAVNQCDKMIEITNDILITKSKNVTASEGRILKLKNIFIKPAKIIGNSKINSKKLIFIFNLMDPMVQNGNLKIKILKNTNK